MKVTVAVEPASRPVRLKATLAELAVALASVRSTATLLSAVLSRVVAPPERVIVFEPSEMLAPASSLIAMEVETVPSARPDRFTVWVPLPVTLATTGLPPPLLVKVTAAMASASRPLTV